MAKFVFRERGEQTAYCDFRLFIEGVEVTKWVQDSVQWQIAGTGSNNSCSFTLANVEDTWLLTPQNICSTVPENQRWRKTTDSNDESAKRLLWQRKNDRNQAVGQDEKTHQWVYPLNPYTPIFHTHDCVRLFIRNPYSYEELWMPAFTGFVSHHPTVDDYIKGSRPLSFQCYCIKGILKRMRVNINPIPTVGNSTEAELQKAGKTIGDFVASDAVLGSKAGFYGDLHNASGLNHILSGKDFDQAIKFLMLGEAATTNANLKGDSTVTDNVLTLEGYGGAIRTKVTAPKDSKSSTTEIKKPSSTFARARGAVGRFQLGKEVKYPGGSLEGWHDIALLGVGGEHFSLKEVEEWGRETVTDNRRGSPWNGYIHLLLPGTGTAAARFIEVNYSKTQTDFSQGFNFSNRYELINKCCADLDFQWYTTPMGDVVFEFPMFDFNPDAFGKNKAIFEVDDHLTTGAIEDEAGDIPTALVVTGTENAAGTGVDNAGANRAIMPGRTVVYSHVLAQRLGAVVETMSAPVGIGSITATDGDMNQKQAAEGLEQWALLQYQKRLGQSSTMSTPLPWRPWLLPNRPLHNKVRERIGLTGVISHNMQDGQVCTTSVQNQYVRTMGPDLKFRYFSTGGQNMPINYSTMFTASGDQDTSSVRTVRQVKKGTSDGTHVQRRDSSTKRRIRRRSAPREVAKIPHRLDDWEWMPALAVKQGKVTRPFKAPPDTILIHSGGTGANVAEYIANNPNAAKRKVATHFSWAGKKGRLVQQVSLQLVSWHAAGSMFQGKGYLNGRSVSIELPGPWRQNPRSGDQKSQLIALVTAIKAAIPNLKYITGHEFVLPKRKRDPGPGVTEGWWTGLGLEVYWDRSARTRRPDPVSSKPQPREKTARRSSRPSCDYCKDAKVASS